jgi:hypothetical protein
LCENNKKSLLVPESKIHSDKKYIITPLHLTWYENKKLTTATASG